MHKNGFLYIATGARFLAEAKISVASLKKHMPGAATCCFTDDVQGAAGHFDHIIVISNPYRNFFEKIPPLSSSPFDRTIFIDTDTLFTADMSDVFELLSRFDIAVVSDPFFCGPKEVPQCFSHLNTGLIAYKNSASVKAFFQAWFLDYEKTYEAEKKPKGFHDQISFQRTLYFSDLRLYILPPEYNLRMTCPQLIRIWAPVKMIHARHRDLKSLGDRLANRSDVRIVWPNWSHFFRNKTHFIGAKSDYLAGLLQSVTKTFLSFITKIK